MMFYDMNLPMLRTSVDHEKTALLGQLFEYGYDCVALNTIVYGRLPKQHRVKGDRIRFDPASAGPAGFRRRKRGDPSLLRTRGGNVTSSAATGSRASASKGPDQILRLTVVLQSPADVQVLTSASEVLQSYDVVAAVPCCQKSFEALCKGSDVDIISLPSQGRMPFNVSKKMADAALARGAVFEVTYSQAIQSSSVKDMMGNAQGLVRYTRGRGIVLSSGAESWLYCRSPHDVANLGQLLGLTQEQAIRAVSDTPLAVLRRAEARKSRFRGITLVGKPGRAELRALELPKSFYLPDAMPSRGKGPGSSLPVEASAERSGAGGGVSNEDNDEDDDENGGFLSFAGAMEVDG